MKKRYFELLLVAVAVAGLAVFLAPDKPDLEPQRFDHAIVQEGAERTWSPRNTTIYDLWQSRFQEGQNALGQGDNPKAEASLEQALALAHRLGSEPTYLTHDALALCYYRQEDYARSRDHQKESIRLAFESQRPELEGLYQSRLALSFHALDEPDLAREALQRARSAYQRAYPKGSPAYSEAMNSLAQQYRNLGDNDAAAEITQNE